MDESNVMKDAIKLTPSSLVEKFTYYIYWISNMLKEEIFEEICVVAIFVRAIVMINVWYAKNKNRVSIKDGKLLIATDTNLIQCNLTMSEVSLTKQMMENNICPIIGPKYVDLRNESKINIFNMIVSDLAKQFMQKDFE